MKAIVALTLPLLAMLATGQAQAQEQPAPDKSYQPPPIQLAQRDRDRDWDRDRDRRDRVPDLGGTWDMNGDQNKPCEVRQRRGERRAEFINERGESAWGTINGDRIWVPD
jgi:hypothetical protein